MVERASPCWPSCVWGRRTERRPRGRQAGPPLAYRAHGMVEDNSRNNYSKENARPALHQQRDYWWPGGRGLPGTSSPHFRADHPPPTKQKTLSLTVSLSLFPYFPYHKRNSSVSLSSLSFLTTNGTATKTEKHRRNGICRPDCSVNLLKPPQVSVRRLSLLYSNQPINNHFFPFSPMNLIIVFPAIAIIIHDQLIWIPLITTFSTLRISNACET